ncbi:MBG domain-containing protein [Mucilaginibacter sp. UR6-11]|uniref:MBG domain-containing protein n=1 Tax=Mucilaginibacter sp. UR6-11 TaxID=1435644 RepID=UPI001E5066FD|nr:MBG domain-containing protein [Mucilaginibacter sp. UR6-11]MCC8423439.1 gliding motility-associated C-terminal domain-containing protein [Mucilaginibacter sp. UR6-11]
MSGLINKLVLPFYALKILVSHKKLPDAIKRLLFIAPVLCFFLGISGLKAQVNIPATNGDVVNVPDFPVTKCVFNWVNSNPEIGLAAKGTGNIGSFTAINTTSAPIVAYINAVATPIPPPLYGNSGGYVSVIDPTTNTQIATILVPNGTLRQKSKDGTIGYFTSAGDTHTLYKVDLLTNTVIANINIPLGISNLQLNNDGSKIYIPAFTVGSSFKTVSVVNTSTNAVEALIDLGIPIGLFTGGSITPDGTRMILLNQLGGLVTIINLLTNTVDFNVPVFKPVQLEISPDSKFAYVTSIFSNTMHIIDISTGSLVNIGLYSIPIQALMSRDGSKIFFFSSDDTNDAVTIFNTGNLALTTVRTGLAIKSFYLSPDNKSLYVVGDLGNAEKIAVIDLDANKVVTTIKISDPWLSVGYHISTSFTVVSYDGNYIYTSFLVSNYYTPAQYRYVSVVNTKNNAVVDSIPNGVIPPQYPPGTCSDPINFTITVNPPPPAILTTGTMVAKTTSYGTPSSSTSFTVSGTHIDKGILVSPPPGFEVSTDGITFKDDILVGAGGTVLATPVYVRLKATAPVNKYAGNIILSSGPTKAGIATALSEVTLAPLTITADAVTKTYGTALTTLAGATTFKTTGLKNDETIGSVTLVYGAGSAATAALGNYPGAVIPSAPTGGTLTLSNYSPEYVAGDIVVTPAQLTITAENKERYFGDANPVLTIKYSGFVNNDDASQLITLPVVTTTAVRTSFPGQYPITISGASATNYDIIYVPGVLTVKTKAVIVTNTFTPNGDGVNDTWDIQNIAQYPECTVEIFSRYGNKVFYSLGYPNPWNGQYNGAALPVGTYYYIIKFNADTKSITGNLTIIR